MSTRSVVQLRGFFEDIPSGSKSIGPADLQNNTPTVAETIVTLASGDNTITVPVSTTLGAIIIFDSTSTTAKKIKGVGGDTGITVTKTKWFVLTFDSPAPANFIINSSAADTGLYTKIIFF